MEQARLHEIAREIIRENIYLTLATSDGGRPWASPLFYCTDDDYNFYFISLPDSFHSRHIGENPSVAFAIFDSRQAEGTGNGVQGSGSVERVPDGELEEALQWYKTDYIELTPQNLTAPAPYRMYKLMSERFYVLDPEARVDKRVEVFLR